MKAIDAMTKVSFRNILYATDFSPAADAALPVVQAIANRYGSAVIGVHVRTPESYPLAPPDTWPALEEGWELQGQQQAEKLRTMLHGMNSVALIRVGDTREQLSTLAKKYGIDLIVMGTRGRTGLAKALLGSVAEQILRIAVCPVLTVGPETAATSSSFEMNRILFATDFSSGSLAAAPYAISLAQENQAALDLLHVVPKQQAGNLLHTSDLAISWAHRLEQLVPRDAGFWCEPNYLVQIGDPAERILDVARSRQAQLIVLGAKCVPDYVSASAHNPWSTAHKVIAHASCPVLTVHG